MRWRVRLPVLVGLLSAFGAVPAQADTLAITGGAAPKSYVIYTDFQELLRSGVGNVEAPVAAVDLTVPPEPSTSGCQPADFAGFPTGSIALMRRGGCTFQLKVDNAIAAGAVGVIIYNSGDPGETGLFQGNLESEVPVPVVAASYAVGVELRSGVQSAPSGITVRLIVDGNRASRLAVVSGSTNWKLSDASHAAHASTSMEFTYRTEARPLVPFTGDWDGNGSETPGTFERGVFQLSNTIPPGEPGISVTFGDPRGFPVAGDFNGDGPDDVAVYRNGSWQVRLSTGATSSFSFGSGSWPFTVPVAGDWDGDGTDGIGTYTLANGTWNLRQTASGGAPDAGAFVFWAEPGSYPVVGDWNDDGTDTVGVKAGTAWRMRLSNTPGPAQLAGDFGGANDLPLTWKPAP